QTWRIPISRGARNRHRALHRRDQRRPQTLPVDRTPKPHPRGCQTWEANVRVDPLGCSCVTLIQIPCPSHDQYRLRTHIKKRPLTRAAPRSRYARAAALARSLFLRRGGGRHALPPQIFFLSSAADPGAGGAERLVSAKTRPACRAFPGPAPATLEANRMLSIGTTLVSRSMPG